MGIALLITVLVILVVAYAVFWLIDNIGLPHPINMLAKAVVVFIAIYYILQKAGVV